MSHFPILIQFTEGDQQGEKYVVNEPEELPSGIGFKVLVTEYIRTNRDFPPDVTTLFL